MCAGQPGEERLVETRIEVTTLRRGRAPLRAAGGAAAVAGKLRSERGGAGGMLHGGARGRTVVTATSASRCVIAATPDAFKNSLNRSAAIELVVLHSWINSHLVGESVSMDDPC